jgi:asparagine synthase (glutamine-hydrolysing)
MTVMGDERTESFTYESPELSIVCRTDLLINDSQAGTAKEMSPAMRVAGLYQAYQDSFVNRLRGTFAIILYDHKLGVLKAWTDHLGAERLVFADSQGFFAVATDTRLLLPLFAERPELDSAAIHEYLQYTCIPAPRTVYKGISRLEPGHQLSWSPLLVAPYWHMTYPEVRERRPEADWTSDTANAIRSAVAQSLLNVSSSRLGCFLSGGTDSSSVTGLVSKLTQQSPRTFSIGFDDPRYNEIRYARIAATHNKAQHHEYFVTPDDILAVIEKAVPAYDEPFGNSSIVPTYYCARLAAENGVTHLLAGDGGDELFGGNSRYVDDRVFQRYHSIPGMLRRLLLEPAVSAGSSLTRLPVFDLASRYIRRSNIPVPDRFHSYSLLSSVAPLELFTPDFLATLVGHNPLAPARRHFSSASADNDLNRWLYMDLKMTIGDNDIRKVTVMSRLGGVTARYPLLDPTLAEFTGTIPADLKIRGSQLRYLFKKAMADVLPPEIITKSKHGFGLPYSVWLKEDRSLQEFTFDVLGSARCRQRGYFRKDLVDWLWEQYLSVHQTYFGDLLWEFLMLELWHLRQHDVAIVRPELAPLEAANLN